MIDFFRNGSFVLPPLVGTVLVAITSLALFMMVMASNDSRVRTAESRCEVGEVQPGSETIRVKLMCQEATGETSTSTAQPSSVVMILGSKPATVVCNVMHTGWVQDCRVP